MPYVERTELRQDETLDDPTPNKNNILPKIMIKSYLCTKNDWSLYRRLANSQLYLICTAQNKCIRQIFFCDKFEHAPPLFKLLDILTFYNIILFKACLLAHKIFNYRQSIPAVFSDIFK